MNSRMIVAGGNFDDLFSNLNAQQRAAACHDQSPLLIVAGAGTGKTTTLAHRVAYLIGSGVSPARILLLTFTRRASAEMLKRVDAILRRLPAGSAASAAVSSRSVWGGTFHAVAARLLRQHARLIGLDQNFTILDRADAEDLINLLRAELKLANDQTRFPLKGTCMDVYSRCVNTQLRLEQVLPSSFPWLVDHLEELGQLFRAYVDRKEQNAALDYDDLLVFMHGLLSAPQSGEVIREKFDHVLVDEYQDTNTLQASIVKLLRPDGSGVTVVGDDAQSIYSFRAATVRNILDFPNECPGCQVVTLEQNYRSTQPILDATNAVISLAQERFTKNLWSDRCVGERPRLVHCLDEDEQTEFLISAILGHRETGIPLKKQAVLYRASHHSLSLEVELSRRNIPFHKYGGLKFIEAAHVKDLLAFLRLAENPKDFVAGHRILLLLPGIGRSRSTRLLEGLRDRGCDLAAWNDFRPPEATKPYWQAFVDLMLRLASRKNTDDVASQVHDVLTFYAPLLEEKYDYPRPRLRDLEQIESLAGRFPSRTEFLTDLTLDPPASTQDFAGPPHMDDDYLILSTIHSAKGLEWDAVYVIHASDGNIPSDMATRNDEEIEEERRLFYVALTRARNWLYVCHPQRYYFHGQYRTDAHSFAQPTRFLPERSADLFQLECAEQLKLRDAAIAASNHMTTANIRGHLKDMWT